jgi:Putative MetA-pathway of phenol degradation
MQRTFSKLWILYAISCGGMTTAGLAQNAELPTISTERPTVGYSPDMIPAGSFQIENGAGLSQQRGRYVADLPESLVRFGLTNRVEARFLTSDVLYQSSHAAGSDGLESADVTLSAKLLVRGPNSPLPKTAVLALNIPTGGSSYTSGSYDPGLTTIWTQAIAGGYFVNEVAGAMLTTLNGARRAEWAPSVAFGRALSPTLTGFGEYAPTMVPGLCAAHVIDGGLALTRGKLQQFDVRTGYLKDVQGSHALISMGYSIRRDAVLRSPFGWGRRRIQN